MQKTLLTTISFDSRAVWSQPDRKAKGVYEDESGRCGIDRHVLHCMEGFRRPYIICFEERRKIAAEGCRPVGDEICVPYM